LMVDNSFQFVSKLNINTFAPRLIQAVRTKTVGSHVALHGNFSVRYALQTWSIAQKTQQVL